MFELRTHQKRNRMNHKHDVNRNSTTNPPPHDVDDEAKDMQLPPQYHIIGDVYVDILCYIPPTLQRGGPTTATSTTATTTTATHHTTTTSVLHLDGTDTAITQPITIMAGGSTINTATYLQYLQRVDSSSTASSSSSSSSSSLDITVHTVFNPNDYYGSILLQHSAANHIALQNAYQNDTCDESTEGEVPRSTPHCMVMISSSSTSTTTISSERTFLTHRGCATNNMYIHDLFPTLSSSHRYGDGRPNGNSSMGLVRPIHYHIAGYYCTPEFWNTNTESKNSSLVSLSSFVTNIFTKPTIRSDENIWSHSNHNFVTSTSTTASTVTRAPIILSLVTQYDATQQWDMTNLKSILPYMHICIMNELEAQQIYCRNFQDTSDGVNSNVDSLLMRMISFFTEFNPSTIYVITQGVKGAIAFRNKAILAQVCGTVDVATILVRNSGCVTNDHNGHATRSNDVIIDPTGAGDAFCAGFFHSLWQSIHCTPVRAEEDVCNATSNSLYRPSEQYWSNATTIQEALLYGCTIGTCSILQRGGSTVPTSDPTFVQTIHDQYKKLRPTNVGTVCH